MNMDHGSVRTRLRWRSD